MSSYSMRFDRFPRPFRKPSVESLNVDADELNDPWFTNEHTPAQPETALEKLRKLLERHPLTAVAFTAATIVASACSSELFRTQPHVEENSEVAKHDPITLPNQIEISTENDDMVIMLGGEYSLRITDWDHREQWDQGLVPETGNPTFAWHRQVLETQYANSFDPAAPAVGIDPIFMEADAYPSFATSYGNMEIGNYEAVTTTLVDSWLTAAQKELHKNFDEESDLSTLTAAEWMYVLQAPTKLLKYDKRLASVFPEYDAKLTDAHWGKNIEELMNDTIGVCRDNERLMVTSYVIANQLFDLADNGLLYLPMVNIVDAKHTRGAFYLSINPVDMVVVGVDTTYGGGDIKNSLTAVSQGEVAIWHSQQYDKDRLFSPRAQLAGLELFLEYSDATEQSISPTAEAIIQREKLQAQLKIYERENNSTKKKQLIEDIYNSLFAQIAEDSLLGGLPLNLPSRLVVMYDQLIHIAKERDRLNGKEAVYEATAKSEFEDYLSRNGVNIEKIRTLTHQIDRLPTDEHQARLERIKEILEIVEAHTSSKAQ